MTTQRKAQFNSLLKRHLLVVDLEATCTNTDAFPREEMEVIEFGGVLLDRDNNWEPVERVEFFIKPTLHPTLSDFCRGLTHITQEQVDEGRSYVWALTLLDAFTKRLGKDWSWCSWGAFDRNILVQNGVIHGLAPLLSPNKHFNMKVWYSSLLETKKGFGLDKAINKEGLEFIGQHHRALSDAENVAQIFRRVYGRSLQ